MMKTEAIKLKLEALDVERKGLRQDLEAVDRQISHLKGLLVQTCEHKNTKRVTKSWTDYSNGQGLDREVYYYAHVCQDCGKEVSTEEYPWQSWR